MIGGMHGNVRETRPTAGRLPDFIVVGSAKCGTTSLHHYLSLHPDVHVSRPKELDFFVGDEPEGSDPQRRPPGPEWANWWRGVDWYRGHFVTTKRVCGEISPSYVQDTWLRQAVARMRRIVPHAKLLLLVRQPLRRLQSHFLMLRLEATIEPVSFAEFVTAERFAKYRRYSHYGSHLRAWLEHFPRESILIVESAALDEDRDRTLGKVFAFLGVDPEFRSPAFHRRLFEGRRRRFPSALGTRMLRSAPLAAARQLLPFTIYETVRHVALFPFTIPPPSLELPDAVAARLLEELRDEVALARRLSGLPLTSLEC